MDYSDQIEAVAEKYGERITAILNRIQEHLVASGYRTNDVFTMHDDNYRWVLATLNDEGHIGEGSIDFTIELAEQRDFDGAEAPAGINFGLTIADYGGVILGGFQPHNFTDDVWVDSADGDVVEARFRELEEADTGDLMDSHIFPASLFEGNREAGDAFRSTLTRQEDDFDRDDEGHLTPEGKAQLVAWSQEHELTDPPHKGD